MSRKEIRNYGGAFFSSNKLKIIKNFVAIMCFQPLKAAHLLFTVTIQQFFPPPPIESAPNFPSNADISQMFLRGNKSLLQEQSSSKPPARKGQSEMQS